MKTTFEVIVGNIGSVYSGGDIKLALAKYNSYVRDSKDNYGRAGGESVTLFRNGEIERNFPGSLERSTQ